MVDKEVQPITPENKEQESPSPDVSSEKKDLTNLQTKIETNKLKHEVIDATVPDIDWSYRLIQGSTMYDALIKIGKNDLEIKEFAENIDQVVRKYLDQELVGFPNSIKNSMSVGIQFAMMETLVKQGAEGSTQFFEAFSRVKSKSTNKAFTGLYKAFGGLGKLSSANEFFILANKVQKFTWYLSDKKNIITASQNIPELMNPNQLKKLLSNPVWSNQAQIDKLDITTLLTLNSPTAVDIHMGEDELKNIVNNSAISGVISKETISAIQKSLKTADKLLETRGKIKTKASDVVDNIASVLDINIPFLGNLGELAGLDFATDILGKREDGGVLNFVLGVLGFHGGLKGLHKEYIKEKLDALDIDNAFVIAACATYQKNIDTTITHDSPTSIWKTCKLSAPDTTIETTIKTKIPTDYVGLKKSLVDNLDTATLNPIMIAKFAPGLVISENNTPVAVDITRIKSNKDAFVDSYLTYIVPLLADPNDDFITSKYIDTNSFALAVMGGLVGDKYFIEGVNIGLLTTTDFKSPSSGDTGLNTPQTPVGSYETIDENDPELLRLSVGPNENYAHNTKFVQFLHTLEQKNGLTYGVMLNLMITESRGELYNADGKTILGSPKGAKGLFQFMPETAQDYIVKLGYTVAEYEKIYTNPIVGAKACAQLLKDLKGMGDNTVNALAHYNYGHFKTPMTTATLSTFPSETQKYITQTGSAMLKYSHKEPILTDYEINNPISIPQTTLENFLFAVNALPMSQTLPETVPHIEVVDHETYKNTTMFVGDSLTVGYAQNLSYRYFKEGMGGKWTGWMNDHFDEAIVATPKPKSIVLLGGANDLCNFSVQGAYNKDPIKMSEAILKNIESMSAKADAAGIQFLVGTILPFGKFIDDPSKSGFSEENKKIFTQNKDIIERALNDVNTKIKEKWGNRVIDYHSTLEDPNTLGYLNTAYDGGDGIHLNTAGYQKMQEIAFATRKELNTRSVA